MHHSYWFYQFLGIPRGLQEKSGSRGITILSWLSLGLWMPARQFFNWSDTQADSAGSVYLRSAVRRHWGNQHDPADPAYYPVSKVNTGFLRMGRGTGPYRPFPRGLHARLKELLTSCT